MNWDDADIVQLMNIAYDDIALPIELRILAGVELKRRARVKGDHHLELQLV